LLRSTTIDDGRFTGCRNDVGSGGAIHFHAIGLLIVDSTHFVECQVGSDGSAVFADGSCCEIAGCTAEKCSATRGLFLFLRRSSLSLASGSALDCAGPSGGLFLTSFPFSELFETNFTGSSTRSGGTAAASSDGGAATADFLTVTAAQGLSCFSIATEPFTVSRSLFLRNELIASGAILSAELV
jgi:hypothetical protein